MYLSQIAQCICQISSHHVALALVDRSSYHVGYYQVLPGYCMLLNCIIFLVSQCMVLSRSAGYFRVVYCVVRYCTLWQRGRHTYPPLSSLATTTPSSFIKCCSPIMRSFQLQPSCTLTAVKASSSLLLSSANQEPTNPLRWLRRSVL